MLWYFDTRLSSFCLLNLSHNSQLLNTYSHQYITYNSSVEEVIIVVYKETQKDQNWLFPLSIREMIPKDHVCFLVEDFVEGLEKVKIEMNLISIAHNLLKIHRMMRENKGSGIRNSNNFGLFRNFCSSDIIVGRLPLLKSFSIRSVGKLRPQSYYSGHKSSN